MTDTVEGLLGENATLRQDLDGARGCLGMIRDRLEELGIDMEHCPPMMYDDAIRSLAARLAQRAGLESWGEVKAVVADGPTRAESKGDSEKTP